MAAPLDERRKALELMNVELQKRLELQFTVGDRIDTKATLVLGFVGIAAQFLLTHPHRDSWVTGAALTSYAFSFLAGVATVALRSYQVVPKPRWLTSEYAKHLASGDSDVVRPLLGKLVGLRVLACEHNAQVDKHKTVAWWLSVGGLTVGLALSATSLSSAESATHGRRTHCEARGSQPLGGACSAGH
jgi:hypothetical protein